MQKDDEFWLGFKFSRVQHQEKVFINCFNVIFGRQEAPDV